MIPALLTCVYVIYLYRKLKDEATVTPVDDAQSSRNAGSTADLAGQIAHLEARLQHLVEARKSEVHRS